MKIEKAVIEEEIDTEEDIILIQDTTFKNKIKCHAIMSENGLWNIDAVNIDAKDINAKDIDAVNIDAVNIDAKDIDAGNIDAVNIDARNIDARDINAVNINAGNIDARDIDARDINAVNINAGNIDARDINVFWAIICETRIKKSETATTKARIFVKEKSKLEKKEVSQ